jgi:hypothetical protein
LIHRPAERDWGCVGCGKPPSIAGVSRMIPKKPVPDLIRDGNRFSEETMRKQNVGASTDPV